MDVPRMAFSCSSDSPRVLMLAMMELMKDDCLDDLLVYFFLSEAVLAVESCSPWKDFVGLGVVEIFRGVVEVAK